ncbi:hypothetical protein [Mariniblastus fucicola]|uniref:Transmembrane protein n=1 Tax=Mariniblastus fucicola TaxID=980251 RepID=A0A5B9P3A7_9BACT|nr:hypothetical protein [Mariniblastus fucicola]QEG21037.1 hypothetical protein MFFC18_08890 [Mariniblastus fucicola]
MIEINQYHDSALPHVNHAYQPSSPDEEPFRLEMTGAGQTVLNQSRPKLPILEADIRRYQSLPGDEGKQAVRESEGRRFDDDEVRQRQYRVNATALEYLRQLKTGHEQVRAQWNLQWRNSHRSHRKLNGLGVIRVVLGTAIGLLLFVLIADGSNAVNTMSSSIDEMENNVFGIVCLAAPIILLILVGLEYALHCLDEAHRRRFERGLSWLVLPLGLVGMGIFSWKVGAFQDLNLLTEGDTGPPFWALTLTGMIASSLVAFIALRAISESAAQYFGYELAQSKDYQAAESWANRHNIIVAQIESRIVWHQEFNESLKRERGSYIEECLAVLGTFQRLAARSLQAATAEAELAIARDAFALPTETDVPYRQNSMLSGHESLISRNGSPPPARTGS